MNSIKDLTKTNKEKSPKEIIFLCVLYLCISIAIITLMTLIFDILSTGSNRLFSDYEVGLVTKQQINNPQDFLTSLDSRDPLKAGIGPAFVGTLWLMIIVIFTTFPLGTGAAIYLEEFAPKNKDRKSTRLNSSHVRTSRMPSSA